MQPSSHAGLVPSAAAWPGLQLRRLHVRLLLRWRPLGLHDRGFSEAPQEPGALNPSPKP